MFLQSRAPVAVGPRNMFLLDPPLIGPVNKRPSPPTPHFMARGYLPMVNVAVVARTIFQDWCDSIRS